MTSEEEPSTRSGQTRSNEPCTRDHIHKLIWVFYALVRLT